MPELAESWSIEDGGRTLRFKLRRGVQFHNGMGEFTARDVKHSFETLMAQPPDTRAIVSQTELKAGIEGAEIVNDYEIAFRAKITDITLLYQWTVNNTGSEITSKADFDARGGKMPTGPNEKPLAGTGPYQYMDRTQGQFIRFERVPYQHWREMPEFPELELRFNSENAARQAALLAGEIHGTRTAAGPGRGRAVTWPQAHRVERSADGGDRAAVRLVPQGPAQLRRAAAPR